MARYIDAELFLQTNAELANCEILHPKCFNTLKELIDEAPTAEVRENVKGEWIHDGKFFKGGYGWMHCSACGRKEVDCPAGRTNFCPNCGANMRGENNG